MFLIKKLLLLSAMIVVPGTMASDAVQFRCMAEFGFLNVLSHKIQFSNKSNIYRQRR